MTVGRYYVEGTIMQLHRPTRHYETVIVYLDRPVSVVFMIYYVESAEEREARLQQMRERLAA